MSTIAQTVLNQIRAMDPAALMAWGAKDLTNNGKGLRFKTSGMTPWKGFVNIILDEGKDLYEVHFLRNRKINGVPTIITDKLVKDVYVEDLINVIDGFVG